ncbi:MAG: tetraacyldisaccharide 4'-kinase [Candidatus Binatia bacterium]
MPGLVHRIWWGRGLLWRVIRATLRPFSWLFGLGVALRRLAYATGIFSIQGASLPVISVGNISSGGSGKTPLVIWLVLGLRNRGLVPAVVSRGYGGGHRGPRLVSDGGEDEAAADEALLVAQRCACPVATGVDRTAACRLIVRHTEAEVVVLDDGFQHRSLRRDLDLVLLSPGDKEAALLPAGPLREPVAALSRADYVLSAEPEGGEIGIRRRPLGLVSRVSSEDVERPPASLANKAVVAVCAIANPASFFAMLEACGTRIVQTLEYPDHHAYGEHDIGEIAAAASTDTTVVTTEKDLVKLGGRLPPSVELLALRITIDVDGGETLLDQIVNRLDLENWGQHHRGSCEGSAG